MADERCRLILGDCMEKTKEIPDGSIDAVITDPPYLTTDCAMDIDFDIVKFAKEIKRILKNNGWFFVFCPFEIAVVFNTMFRRKFEYIWIKNRIIPQTYNTIHPHYAHEIIYAFIKPELRKMTELTFNKQELRHYSEFGSYITRHTKQDKEGIFEKENRRTKKAEFITINDGLREPTTLLFAPIKNCIPHNERTTHPTQKPAPILMDIVRGYTNKNDLILDPFMGSGTTGVAALRLNRRFIGIELDEGYFKIAQKRIGEVEKQERLI